MGAKDITKVPQTTSSSCEVPQTSLDERTREDVLEKTGQHEWLPQTAQSFLWEW